ncbi:MAG: hypothetical protein COT74_00080 [Bdellovibrionales bacterium CG10_big_fil_rev_8_21_14_0_10_45_34]|nr:MAG: hypothetical protein COT74_00080 [Bdellovibrionales bacterium CG10_big_fil_rev_8_21_14_0_10_45_34]
MERLIIASFIAGAYLLFDAFKRSQRRRKVEDTPRSRIETAPQGHVEFEGFAWPLGETTVAADGNDSVYYTFELQKKEKTGSGKSRRSKWTTIFSKYHILPIYVFDGSGLAIVDPSSAKLELVKKANRRWALLDHETKQRIRDFVADKKAIRLPSWGLLGNFLGPSYRIKQCQICVGAPLYVSGHFKSLQTQTTQSAALAEFYKLVYDTSTQRLRNNAAILDTNNDSKISAKEIRRGYPIAAQIALRRAEEKPGSDGSDVHASSHFQIYGTVGSSDHEDLFVSDLHEEHLSNHLGRALALRYAAGAMLLALAMGLGVDMLNGNFNRRSKRSVSPKQHATKQSSPAATTHPSNADQGDSPTTLGVGSVRQIDRKVAIADSVSHESALIESEEKQHEDSPVLLHERCVGGDQVSCRTLVFRSENYQLSEKHISYYKHRACQLGAKSLCETKAP